MFAGAAAPFRQLRYASGALSIAAIRLISDPRRPKTSGSSTASVSERDVQAAGCDPHCGDGDYLARLLYQAAGEVLNALIASRKASTSQT